MAEHHQARPFFALLILSTVRFRLLSSALHNRLYILG